MHVLMANFRLLLRCLLVSSFILLTTSESIANAYFSEANASPGFITRINQRGLDLLASYLKNRVKKFMQNADVPLNFTAPLTKEVTFALLSSNFDSFDATAFQSRLTILPTKGVAWIGSRISSTVTSVFKVKSDTVEVIGKSNMTIEGAAVELHFLTGINSDGHLKTDMTSCKVHARHVAMNFSQTDAVLLSNYFVHINRFAKERVEEVLCSKFYAELMPSVSNRLMNSPMSAILFEHYFINYAMIDHINYTDKYVELRHRGNTFAILRQGRNRLNDFRLPFRSPPLRASNETYGMLDFYLSNYTLSSLLFWMDQYRKFDYEISKESVGSETLAGYLKTECAADDVCAGTLFPALAARFPKGIVQIKTHTTKHPRVAFEDGKGIVYLESQVDAFVQQPERSSRFLTAKMTVDMGLTKAAFKDYELTAEMKIEKFKIFDVVSSVDGIDATSLEFLVSALNELVIADDIAKKLKGGINLPIMLDFTQKSAEVVFEKDLMRISTEFCFDQNCEAIAESKDEGDYYDAVQG